MYMQVCTWFSFFLFFDLADVYANERRVWQCEATTAQTSSMDAGCRKQAVVMQLV
jgi:hypothetical protein